MLEVLIGFVAGIVSGTGMGGGTILILLLTLFLGKEQHIAQATNLVFFIPTAIAAIIINFKQHYIKWKLGTYIGIIGIIGAVGGAMLASKIESGALRRYFGIFLGMIAIYEIYQYIKSYKSKKIGDTTVKEQKSKEGKETK